MKSLFLKLLEELSAGRSAVLLTIIDTMGSTPRGAGSHQLILEDGSAPGTVGEDIRNTWLPVAGRKALRKRRRSFCLWSAQKDPKADIGAVCGGELRVFRQYFDRSVPSLMPLLDRTVQCLAGQQACRLFWDLTDPAHWGMALFTDDGPVCCRPVIVSVSSGRTWAGPEDTGGWYPFGHSRIGSSPACHRFQGGHVAKALVPSGQAGCPVLLSKTAANLYLPAGFLMRQPGLQPISTIWQTTSRSQAMIMSAS